MKNSRIYLSPPHMSGKEQHFITEAFKSNWVGSLGPNVDELEHELATYVGAKGAVALSSGTAAIHLALHLAGVERGDKIFCSSLTFIASINPVLYMSAVPVLIDSEPQSWNMSPNALQRAFDDAEKTGGLPKAVIVVNLYGQSADMFPIIEICDNYGIPVIEDAAESLGTTYKGRASGTLGKFGIYSFNGNKIITTSGGGMLISDDTVALKRARFLATQARDPAVHYQHSQVGYNYRLSNILAGIGREQLKVLNERVEARRLVFDRYYKELSSFKGVTFMPEADFGRCSRWLTVLLLAPDQIKTTHSEIIEIMEENNIETRPIWKPMHLQPLLKDCTFYPHIIEERISDKLFEQGLCLPSGSNLTEEEQNRVIQCLKSFLQ